MMAVSSKKSSKTKLEKRSLPASHPPTRQLRAVIAAFEHAQILPAGNCIEKCRKHLQTSGDITLISGSYMSKTLLRAE